MKRIILAVLTLVLFTVALLGTTGCPAPVAVEDERHTLRVGAVDELEGLNPHLVWSMLGYEVMLLNYNMLITWDEELNPAPALAKSWSVDEEGTLWTFNLEEGVLWHDGTPFTAEDVKFTFEYIRDNELGYFLDPVAGMEEITAVDEHTLTIKTDQPLAWMPGIIVPILPKHIWAEIDPEYAGTDFANENPVGTGPFQVVEFVRGQYVRLEANENYFRGAPGIDEVIFIQFANADLMVEALKKGDIDVAVEVPGASLKALEEAADPNIVTLDADSPSFSQLGFNVWVDDAESEGNPLLLDRNIRVAIEHAMNRQEIIAVAHDGFGTPGSTLIPPFHDFWHFNPGAELRAYDPAKAAEILEGAGYTLGNDGIRVSPAGEPLSFDLIARSESVESQQAATLIKDMLAEVGIEITVTVIDEGTLTDRLPEGDFDMFLWGWFTEVDPTSILRVKTTAELMSWNETFYSNPVYDELHLRQQRTMDREERQQLVHEMQRIIYEDVPYIIYSNDPELMAYRTDRFEGWVRNPPGGPVIYQVSGSIRTYEELRPLER